MSQPLPVSQEVMVLGGAPEAGLVSQELLSLGYTVRWVSPEAAAEVVPAHPALSFYAACTLQSLEGHVGGFLARFERDGQPLALPAAALVVATGNERFYPAERYALALAPNVLTTAQLSVQLDAPRKTGAATAHRNERLLILLDYGGETAKETATEALRLAIRLRAAWHSEVYVFYQNLKVDSYGLERLTRAAREKGVVFCRYADPQLVRDDEGISLNYIEGTIRGSLLVLPEAVRPRADTAELARLMRVRVGADGYFQDVNIRQYRPGLSVRRGILFTGRCHLDGDLEECKADAANAVANVAALLGSGSLAPEPILAHVDSSKCVRCLTCVRTCPHAAVEIATYDDVVAARVVDQACQGCGACVANCPVRAIELVGQTMPVWMDTPQGGALQA